MNNREEKNIVNISPDYASMATANSTVAILNAVIKQLFKANGFTIRGLGKLAINVVLLIVLKRVLEKTGDKVDKFSFSDLKFVKYMIQRLKYRHRTWTMTMNADDTWTIGDDLIDFECLSGKLAKQGVVLETGKSSYLNNFGTFIRITRDGNMVTFTTVDNAMMVAYINNHIIDQNRKLISGPSNTVIYRLSFKSQWSPEYEPMEPSPTLPVQNYISLAEILEKRGLSEDVFGKDNVPCCVNFDGPPGTGKTSFASYVATQGIFDNIYIFNMVTETHGLNLAEICAKINEKVFPADKKLDILFFFDEIDKWLERYVNECVRKEQEESRKKTGRVVNTSDKNVNPVVPDKMSDEDVTNFRQQKIDEVVTHFHRLVDGHAFKSTRHRFVFIFNTNNFDDTFVPIVGKTYQATLDRIHKYDFPLIGKPQIIQYFKSMADAALSKPKKTPRATMFVQNIIDQLVYLDGLREDVAISYRELSRVLIQSSYNISGVVKLVNSIGTQRFEEQKNEKASKRGLVDRINVLDE